MTKPPRRPEPPSSLATSGAEGEISSEPPGADSVLRSLSPAEIAQYIAELTAELGVLARHANLDLLAYFLDMARLEATNTVARSPERTE